MTNDTDSDALFGANAAPAVHKSVWDMVGSTPAVGVPSMEDPERTIWLKLEGMNPTGSIKDRAAAFILLEARKAGILREGQPILDASSGNFASSLAYFGRLLGHPVHLIVSSKLTPEKAEFLNYFGATFERFGDFTIDGNRRCRKLVADASSAFYFVDQLHNWANPKAHKLTTGPEISGAFPRLGLVVGSLGSGGTLHGVASHLRDSGRSVHVVAVEAASGSKIPGAGAFADGDYVTPFIEDAADQRLFADRLAISASQAERASLHLRDHGVFAGLQTAAVFLGACAASRTLPASLDAVAISGDTGWKNLAALNAIAPVLPVEPFKHPAPPQPKAGR